MYLKWKNIDGVTSTLNSVLFYWHLNEGFKKARELGKMGLFTLTINVFWCSWNWPFEMRSTCHGTDGQLVDLELNYFQWWHQWEATQTEALTTCSLNTVFPALHTFFLKEKSWETKMGKRTILLFLATNLIELFIFSMHYGRKAHIILLPWAQKLYWFQTYR